MGNLQKMLWLWERRIIMEEKLEGISLEDFIFNLMYGGIKDEN